MCRFLDHFSKYIVSLERTLFSDRTLFCSYFLCVFVLTYFRWEIKYLSVPCRFIGGVEV